MKNLPYQAIDVKKFARLAEVVYDEGDILVGDQISIKRIRLTILDVYPGKKYEDTCISEIFFF